VILIKRRTMYAGATLRFKVRFVCRAGLPQRSGLRTRCIDWLMQQHKRRWKRTCRTAVATDGRCEYVVQSLFLYVERNGLSNRTRQNSCHKNRKVERIGGAGTPVFYDPVGRTGGDPVAPIRVTLLVYSKIPFQHLC